MRNIIFNEKKIILDNGYFFGRGVFETILIKNNPLFLQEHIERLNRGIKVLGLGDEVSKDNILKLINKYSIKNCVLKLAISERNLILETRHNKYKAEDYLKGFSLKLSNINRNSKSKLTYIKSLNYLENIIERAVIFCKTDMITIQELPVSFKPKTDDYDFSFNGSLDESVRKFERDYILRALETNDNNKEKTADALRVGLSTLYRKLKELDIKI